jgi:hypothetical protein
MKAQHEDMTFLSAYVNLWNNPVDLDQIWYVGFSQKFCDTDLICVCWPNVTNSLHKRLFFFFF